MERLPSHGSYPAAPSGFSRLASSVSIAAAGAAALVGAAVLLGWLLDVEELKGVYAGITMKTNAAIGLVLCGTSLWAHACGFRRIGIPSAFAGAAIGALTLSQHLVGWDLGIDQLLFTERPGAAATTSPNRMGPNSATNLMLSGTALLLLYRQAPGAARHAQFLALACMLLSTLAITGYTYGAVELYGIARYTGIALHTAIAWLVLNVGILAARVEAEPMAVFVAAGPAGTLLRRLVAPVVCIPLILGYLVMLGRQADLYDRGLSFALFAVSVVIVLAIVVWKTAKTIASSEDHRRRAEHDRDQLLVRERHARDQAESASRLKDQFIAMLSHELRTPLNVMLGWTSVLELNASPERHARAAAVVARNGRLLARLVEDLLDISRASAGQFDIARRLVSFNAVVQGSIDALAPMAAEKGMRLAVALDPAVGTIDGDPERIQQIVSNLLSNSVKFTSPGGHVEIRTAMDGDAATMTVADTGIGFDQTFASQLFQPFRQADSSVRREYGGLGLGLSIAKHIAELHGGSIAGSSPGPGRGATFTVRLPLLAPTTGAARQAGSEEAMPPRDGSEYRGA